MLGGGCTSVGVIGWTIGGGYGALSRKYGTGATSLLEAKIVTANGDVVIASEFQNDDLFYAMRGGGYGFGVVISITVRTHPLPEYFGSVVGLINSNDEQSGEKLVKHFLDFYKENLLASPDWGDQLLISKSGNGFSMEINMLGANFTQKEVEETWAPFLDWIEQRPNDFKVDYFVQNSYDARDYWDLNVDEMLGGKIKSPYNPGEPERSFYFASHKGLNSAYWMSSYSRFLKVGQFLDDTQRGSEILMNFIKITGNAGC